MPRHDGRQPLDLRPLSLQRHFTRPSPGSVLVRAGETTVLCVANVSPEVPRWLQGAGRGWVTAEYNMMPGSTQPRKARDRKGSVDGRTTEIQRLIGRSLRAVCDLEALGECMITVDCDVLEADGGTRTASISGALVALVDAIATVELPDPSRYPLRDSVAAISAGIVEGECLLDLDYPEDAAAAVDMNVVMTGSGRFVEIQGTGEGSTFDDDQLSSLIKLTRDGIGRITQLQRESLGADWPFG